MAVEAQGILRVAELEDRRSFLAAADPRRMRATRAMAGLALQLTVAERTSGIRRHGVFAAE
jgi:hypothetical protein